MYFVHPPPSGPPQDGILKAYSSAQSLISHVITSESSHNTFPYMPVSTVRTILTAIIVIWKVLNSNFSASLDKEQGKTLFYSATYAIRSLALSDTDAPARAASGMNRLWTMGEERTELKEKPPILSVNTRRSASILWDCLCLMRDYKNKDASFSSSRAFREQQSSDTAAPRFSTNNLADTVTPNAIDLPGSGQQGLNDPTSWAHIPDIDWLWDTHVPGIFEL